jgi:hypothetical protein
MTIDLTDNKAFDDYVAQFGWGYDSGGVYVGQHWEWYAGPVRGLVLMRQPPSRVAIVRYDGLTPSELWSGQVMTDLDFDNVMALLGHSRIVTPEAS